MQWRGLANSELETGETLDNDNSIIVDASSMKSVSYHVKHTAYDVVWVGEWRGDKRVDQDCVFDTSSRNHSAMTSFAVTPGTFCTILWSVEHHQRSAGELSYVPSMHARTEEEIYLQTLRDVRSSR